MSTKTRIIFRCIEVLFRPFNRLQRRLLEAQQGLGWDEVLSRRLDCILGLLEE